MDRNNLKQNKIVVNTKFLNSLQPEWSKYVTRSRQEHRHSEVDYDVLFDFLTRMKPEVNASRANELLGIRTSCSRLETHMKVDIQGKSLGYVGSSSRNAGNQERNAKNQGIISGNGFILLAAKDEAGVHFDEEENDFMLMSAYGDDQLEEINASVTMMARL
ncbi:hypothetical protein Tco_0659808 [Tanacetum coccineum]